MRKMNAEIPLMVASATPKASSACPKPADANMRLNMRAEARIREAFLLRCRSARMADRRTKEQGGLVMLR